MPTTRPAPFSSEFLAQLERLALLSRRVFRGRVRGERRSPRRGHSVEFCDYRAYGVGDDLRSVDWNIYGRLDRLHVKLFAAEEDRCLHLLLDAPPARSPISWIPPGSRRGCAPCSSGGSTSTWSTCWRPRRWTPSSPAICGSSTPRPARPASSPSTARRSVPTASAFGNSSSASRRSAAPRRSGTTG